MGLSGKPHLLDGGGLEPEGKRWAIAGIPLRAPLKPIYTTTHPAALGSVGVGNNTNEVDNGDDNEDLSTTPTSAEARIPSKRTCPGAPRKRKSSLKCNYSGGRVREFFTPPDLESVFVRRAERAAAN